MTEKGELWEFLLMTRLLSSFKFRNVTRYSNFIISFYLSIKVPKDIQMKNKPIHSLFY